MEALITNDAKGSNTEMLEALDVDCVSDDDLTIELVDTEGAAEGEFALSSTVLFAAVS